LPLRHSSDLLFFMGSRGDQTANNVIALTISTLVGWGV
jgi:hypothetical protein